ncbi:MAG TPA: M28 family peptidase, partial [Baekduia sp.]|nr:M28 family peptidase [Baekduia sp.]
MPKRSVLAALALLALAAPAPAPAAAAPAAQPPLDITKLSYQPIGALKPTDTLPAADTGCQDVFQPQRKGEVFNPSGTFNSFDTNVFETLCYPFRGPGDKTDDDPVGNRGSALHGRCGGPYEPTSEDGREYGNLAPLAGTCHNHQREWSRYYAETMREILGDFGVSIRQYRFEVEDPGLTGNTRYGTAINTAAVVPGVDNPDETVIVGAHYDKTNDGPASAWDSQEGHAEMIRMAKLMADYWRATGTRPSATVKFIPWDAEESGTFGSQDYAENNVVPGEEFKVRGYFNTDPCAGGYPSYRFGNPLDRISLGIQLADPAAISGIAASDAARITAFNRRAPELVEQVLDHLDDTVPTLGGARPAFVSAKEPGGSDVGKLGGITISSDRDLLFSSDWRNFEVLGIPFFNPGPSVTGIGQTTDGTPTVGLDQSFDALTTFHTPNDNLQTMFRYTGGDLSGTRYSESWAKGMEFCSHLLTWGMLQHDQGGAQTADRDVVAYYEALPNEAIAGQKVAFDATGSHQLADTGAGRAKVPASELTFTWDFGDGTSGAGQTTEHQYREAGKYVSKLTVRNRRTGQSDVMEVPITVIGSSFKAPVLAPPAAPEDEDGTFDLKWDYTGDRGGQEGFVVEEAPDAATVLDDPATTLERWTAAEPKGGLQPWQLASSDTDKPRGNLRQSDPTSFWTGLSRADSAPLVGPGSGESQLVLKEAVTLPRGTSSLLTFASDLAMDNNDQARVDVAIDTPDGLPTEWETVERIKVSEDTGKYALGPDEAFTKPAAFEQRVVDLSRFAG